MYVKRQRSYSNWLRSYSSWPRSGFLITPHPLTNFEIQKCFQNDPKFKDVYSRYYLSKIKDGTYVISVVKYESKGTYWIALYVNGDNVT